MKTQTGILSFVGALGVLFLSTDSVALAREDGQMTLWIKVVMADGSPAAGAIVESLSDLYDPDVVVTADAAGQARLDGVFGGGAKIWARSADGAYQATKTVPPSLVRSAAARPVELELSPAASHEVSVLSQGQPVDGAQVAVIGSTFRARGVTNEDGKCRIRFPSDGTLRALAAWHAELGVASRGNWKGDDLTKPTHVSLIAHAPYTVRVLDTVGRPVGRLEVCTVRRRPCWDRGGIQSEDGSEVFSYAVWPKDIPSLLPKVDKLALMQSNEDKPNLIDWDTVTRVVGDLMTAQGIYPERYRVTDFPSEEQLKAMRG